MSGTHALFIRPPSHADLAEPHPQNAYLSFDIGYASSLMRSAGITTELVDLKRRPARLATLDDELARLRPDLVFIETTSANHQLALDIASRTRARCIAFGQHPTIDPTSLLFPGSPIDLCVVGEPELTMAEVACDHDEVPGTAVQGNDGARCTPARPLIRDLDSLPFPDHALFGGDFRCFYPFRVKRELRFGFILTSRGCPHRCIFCSRVLRKSFGSTMRYRSVENVVAEMDFLVRCHGVTALYFDDDLFTADKARIHRLCDAIIDSGLDVSWAAQSRVDDADADLCSHMREAGCATVNMGVESGSQRVLDLLQKDITLDQIHTAFAAAREAGLFTVAYFMVGNPTETREELDATFSLARKLAPDLVQMHFFTAYPGSIAHDSLCLGGHGTFHYSAGERSFSEVPPDELAAAVRQFYRQYYLSPSYLPEYLKHRASLLAANPSEEMALISTSLRYLMS